MKYDICNRWTHTTSCDNSFRQILSKFEKNQNFSLIGFNEKKAEQLFEENIFELEQSFNIENENYMIATLINQEEREFPISEVFDKSLVSKYKEKVDAENLIHKTWLHHYGVLKYAYNDYKSGAWVNHHLGFDEMVNNFIKPKKVLFVGDVSIVDKYVEMFGDFDYTTANASDNYTEILEKSKDSNIVLLKGEDTQLIIKRLWNDNRNLQVLDLLSL